VLHAQKADKAARMPVVGVHAHPGDTAGARIREAWWGHHSQAVGARAMVRRMDPAVASAIAKRAHLGQTDRFGARVAGLSRVEEAALDLLARRDGETYETYALRIAFAPGDEGCLARAVKRAELDAHIASAPVDVDTPPYAWARRHIANAQWRNHEAVTPFAISPLTSDAPLSIGA